MSEEKKEQEVQVKEEEKEEKIKKLEEEIENLRKKLEKTEEAAKNLACFTRISRKSLRTTK